MRCGVVDLITGEVLNTIIADPDKDAAPKGSKLVALGYASVDQNFVQNADGDFVLTVTAADVEAAVADQKADIAAGVIEARPAVVSIETGDKSA